MPETVSAPPARPGRLHHGAHRGPRRPAPLGGLRRGHGGTAEVILTIDRQGRLLDSRIVRGSGNAELDEEALAVLKRAEPSFRLPPPAVRGDRLDLNVAVNFLRPEGSVAKR